MYFFCTNRKLNGVHECLGNQVYFAKNIIGLGKQSHFLLNREQGDCLWGLVVTWSIQESALESSSWSQVEGVRHKGTENTPWAQEGAIHSFHLFRALLKEEINISTTIANWLKENILSHSPTFHSITKEKKASNRITKSLVKNTGQGKEAQWSGCKRIFTFKWFSLMNH